MTVLSFMSMCVLMYSMANTINDVYNSLNHVYMAGLMTAPMVVIELLLMSGTYKDKRRNGLILAESVVAGAAFFGAIRQQTAVGDRQFLRSMIPHHAGAILCAKKRPCATVESRNSAKASCPASGPRSIKCDGC